jgi:hypothetical protein
MNPMLIAIILGFSRLSLSSARVNNMCEYFIIMIFLCLPTRQAKWILRRVQSIL